MSDAATPLAFTLSTWVFLQHAGGNAPSHEAIKEICETVSAATDGETGEVAGESLVAEISALLDGDSPTAVTGLAQAVFGQQALNTMGVGDRAERTHRIRQFQFESGLPWLARIWERDVDGKVSPVWIIIERVTDEVTAMDPNPWDDIDEERHIPINDFHVLWELDACTSIHLA